MSRRWSGLHAFSGAVALLLLGAATSGHAQAAPSDERVLSFQADVTVNRDASLLVVETIVVHAAGGAVDHGIYRDLPTRARGFQFFETTTPFDIVDVRRDGRPEPYTVATHGTDLRVRIGDRDRRLGVGDFTYTLTYRTVPHLRAQPERDELYWNVTGNDWELPIEEASAIVHLPPGADGPVGPLEGFTGPSGSTARDLRVEQRAATPVFTTTRPLARHEGLTIRLGWAKGLVVPPGAAANRATFARDNARLLVAAALVTCLFAYFLIAWRRVGRDPPPGPMVVTSRPPEALSPAALRYVLRMGVDDNGFAAALLSLADKGHLRIAAEHGGRYTLTRQSRDTAALPPEERALADALFARDDVVRLGSAAAAPVAAARAAMSNALGAACGERYFSINAATMRAGLLFSAIVLVVLAVSSPGEARAATGFLSVWLAVWSLVVSLLAKGAFQAWRRAANSGFRPRDVARAVITTVVAVPFAAGEVGALFAYGALTSGAAALLVAATLVTDGLLILLLPRHTARGRQVLDGAAGYQAFLERTPAGGEGVPTDGLLLAYAVALGAVDRLAGRLTHAMTPAPSWYAATNDPAGGDMSPGAFADSLASAVSSSSSSSGGGGSSGGGDGGGGGGGW